MMWILICRNQEEEIFKLNNIVTIHSFGLTKLVMMSHVPLHVIKYIFNLIKHSVHGLFLDLKTNNNYYFDIILFLLFLVHINLINVFQKLFTVPYILTSHAEVNILN